MLVNVKPLRLAGGIKTAVDTKARLQPEHGTAERWRYVTFPFFWSGLQSFRSYL